MLLLWSHLYVNPRAPMIPGSAQSTALTVAPEKRPWKLLGEELPSSGTTC